MRREELAPLAFLAPVDEWKQDADGDWSLSEDGENPGWLLWLDGQRLKLSWGCIDFESDVYQDDLAKTARWLMSAAAAWGQE